ncbi:MAG: hypothetical protein F6K24_51575, partial [Okeania sp. SIO2D1]|nr:hypothetical protein [Okeania sp. SIO2D1]
QQKIAQYQSNVTTARREINQLQASTYQQALQSANDAFTLSQRAIFQEDWQLVAMQWNNAAQQMEAISPQNPKHALAQQKAKEYRRNATTANQEAQKQDYYQQGLIHGQRATVASHSAQTAEDWSKVARDWLRAIELLQRVPNSSPDYEKATSKIAEYEVNLAIAGEKLIALTENAVR